MLLLHEAVRHDDVLLDEKEKICSLSFDEYGLRKVFPAIAKTSIMPYTFAAILSSRESRNS